MKLNLYLKKNKLNKTDDIKKYLVGKRVKILTQSGGHNYGSNGKYFTISKDASFGSMSMSYGIDNKSNNISYDQLDIENNIDDEIKNVKEQISSLEKELKALNDKKTFMTKNKLTEWDQNQFKVYQTLQLLKSKKSDIDKAKIIAELIKN